VDSPARRFPVINVNDQFWTTRTGVAVLRPAELCTPADDGRRSDSVAGSERARSARLLRGRS